MKVLNVRGETLCQSLGAIYGNLANLAFGGLLGWMLTTALHLQTDKSHLTVPPINETELSWLISSIFLSGSAGILFVGWLGDFFGRKRTMCMLSIAHIGSWTMYMFATNTTELYIANIMVGLVGGGTLGLMPLFVAEIASDRIRGFLGSITMLSFHTGLLLAFIIQYFLLDKYSTYVLILLPCAFLYAILYVPDTPIQLRKERRHDDALKSLQFYSGCPTEVEQKSELYEQHLRKFNESAVASKTMQAQNTYSSRGTRKALSVSISLIIVQHLCVNLIVLVYINEFPLTDMPLIAPNLSAIIFGVCHVAGSALSLISDKTGRKPLMLISLIGTLCGLIVLGLSDFNVFEEQTVNWTAYTSLGVIAFFASAGICSLTPVIITEIMPSQIRQSSFVALLSFGWMLTFVVFKFNIVAAITVSVFAFILAALCLISILAVWVWLPETKLKSYSEIEVRLSL